MKHLTFAIILLFIIVSGCQNLTTALPPTGTFTPQKPDRSSPIPPTPVGTIPDTPTPDPTTQVIPAPTFTPTTEVPGPFELRPQYTISATLDYGWRYLTVIQDIRIPNPSKETLDELNLVVQSNWRPDTFRLTAISWQDGAPIDNFSLDGILLRVPLRDPFEPGETLHISLAYEINIPPIMTSEDFGPNPFGYTTRQTNLTDWYPFVPPYTDGEGWLVHKPWYYGEHLVYPAADFEVIIQLENAPANTVIAASARDVSDGNLHHYLLEGARNFVWSVSPEYRVFQVVVGDTTVLGYAFPYDVGSGAVAFKTTAEALALYNQIFGLYPFETMTVVQADFDHGMEYSGLFFLSRAFYSIYDGTPSTFLVSIAAHETAHQWWYGLVGNDQAMEPWLDEALCTYSEKLFYEKLYPASLDWWEKYRIEYYEPVGWVDSTIYNTQGYRPYRDAVYLNGANFLDELRTLVGEEAFFSFLQDYLACNTSRLANADDFFAILREHSDADWNTLLSSYFQTRK
jgi:hypothetical protein